MAHGDTGIRVSHGQSLLIWPVCSLLNIDVDACLLVEPIVIRLPLLAWVHEADVEVPDDLGDQLIDLA